MFNDGVVYLLATNVKCEVMLFGDMMLIGF